MATITAISHQQRNVNRFNIYLDGEFAFGLAAAVANGLRLGQELSSAEINTLQENDEAERARTKALQLISRRPRSVAEIERNLYKNGFDNTAIKQAIDRLEEVDLLNDLEFASYWVEQREAFRPRSKLVLRQELHSKGISRTVIDTVLIDVDEESAALTAGQKQSSRWVGLPEEEFRNRLGGFLQRRGYPYDVIKLTIDKIWQALVEEEDNEFGRSDY